MAYIGISPVVGEFRKLDDISSQFNDSNTTFNLSVAGSAVTAGSAQNLIISIDGVIQEPQIAYTVSSSTISFTEAPNTGSSFFGILLGSVAQIGVPSDDTISTSKIQNDAVTTDKILDDAVTEAKIAQIAITSSKISGILPVTKGGTGNTTATFTSLTSNVYGLLPAANGGTGINGSSASNGQIIIGNGSGFTANTITGTTNRVTVTNGVGAITLSSPQDIATSSNVQFGSFGVGTAASGTTGEIRATNNVTAFYSDKRLKNIQGPIDSALDKLNKISGVYYTQNEVAESFGYNNYERQVGVIAQEVQEVLPEAVKPAPFDRELVDGKEVSKSGQEYLTVQYEKLVPLLIEAIKELQAKVDKLEG